MPGKETLNIVSKACTSHILVIWKTCYTGTYFLRFPKPEKFGKVLSLTAKVKEKVIHTFGRKHFTIDKIAEDTYISSPHFVEGKVPTNVDLC